MEENTFWILANRNQRQIYLMALNEFMNYAVGNLPLLESEDEHLKIQSIIVRVNNVRDKIGVTPTPIKDVKISNEDALLVHYALSRLALKYKIQISIYEHLLGYDRLIQQTTQPGHYSLISFSQVPYDELVEALSDIEDLCKQFSDELDNYGIVVGRILQHYYNHASREGCTFSMVMRETPSFLEIKHIPNDTKYDLGFGYTSAREVPILFVMESDQKVKKVKKANTENETKGMLYGYHVWNGIPTRYSNSD